MQMRQISPIRIFKYSCFLLLMMQGLFGSGCTEHTTDEEMIHKFQEHQPTFEKLTQMIREDQGLHIGLIALPPQNMKS